MSTCFIKGCPNTNSEFSHDSNHLCIKHTPFYKGLPSVNNTEMLSLCKCGAFKLYNTDGCSKCESSLPELTSPLLDRLEKISIGVYNGPAKRGAGYIGTLLDLLLPVGNKLEDILLKLEQNPSNMCTSAFELQRKPTKMQFAQECKESAIQVATEKLVDSLRIGIVTFAKKANADSKTVEALEEFTNSMFGQLAIETALAGAATYAPIPKQSEKIVSLAAKELRKKSMRTLGSRGLTQIKTLLTSTLEPKQETTSKKENSRKTVQSSQNINIEIPVEILK